MLLCIDESGNTSDLIALGLTAIPKTALGPLMQIFTLRPNDPDEIRALYNRDPEIRKRKPGEAIRPRNEFKYSDFINAERAANLPIYRQFVKEKLKLAAALPIRTFCSLFDKPADNALRRDTLNIEANTLLLLWGTRNIQSALKPTLEIVVDNQVFPEEMLFQVYERRNQFKIETFPTRTIAGKVHYGGRENEKVVVERGSKEFKPLQFTDFVVGAVREAYFFERKDMLDILKPIMPRENIRNARGEYRRHRGFEFRKS